MRVEQRMNSTKVHGLIAAVHASIGDAYRHHSTSPATVCNNLSNDIARLTSAVDAESPKGAAELRALRMASEAITAGESVLKYLASIGSVGDV